MPNEIEDQQKQKSTGLSNKEIGAAAGGAAGLALAGGRAIQQQTGAGGERVAAIGLTDHYPTGSNGAGFNSAARSIHMGFGDSASGRLVQLASDPKMQAVFQKPAGTIMTPAAETLVAATGEQAMWAAEAELGVGVNGVFKQVVYSGASSVSAATRASIQAGLARAPGVPPKIVAAALSLAGAAGGAFIGDKVGEPDR
ncbi:hypothetical protein HSX11_09275 [Oxalobacteraceae bacterium]|nr:hypothetical protein [Oxalobacteraceae bacterium]